MVEINNFSNVWAIGFAMNAVFYLFDFMPNASIEISKLMEKFEEVAKEKIEITKNAEVAPLGFLLFYWVYNDCWIITRTSICMSAVCLSLLIISGFAPETQMSTLWVSIVLFLVFLSPVYAIARHRLITSTIESETHLLKQEIINAKIEIKNGTFFKTRISSEALLNDDPSNESKISPQVQ